jgi:hypothetical protein
MEHRKDTARPVAGLDHRVRFRGGERHDLINNAMASGRESTAGELGVRVMGCGDDDELSFGIIKRIVKVWIPFYIRAALRHSLGTNPGIARDDPVQPQPRLPADERAVKRSPSQSISHHNRRDHVVPGHEQPTNKKPPPRAAA